LHDEHATKNKKKREKKMTKHLDPTELRQFTGTENWYRHGLARTVTYTDGVKYVAETAGAYWLVDAIAIAQRHVELVRKQRFQFWKLVVHADAKATLICEDGNNNEVHRQEIAWTDFPPEGIQFYCCEDGTHRGITRVILLPSEY
jgi:hypothetical protein